MFVFLKRIFIYILSKLISFDDFAEKFPVSVKVLIKNDEGVLLLQNQDLKWDLPGGKIESNEDISQTIKREIFEETNLKIESFKLITSKKIHINSTEVIVLFYTAKIEGHSPIKITNEHVRYGFINPKKIDNIKILSSKYKDFILKNF